MEKVKTVVPYPTQPFRKVYKQLNHILDYPADILVLTFLLDYQDFLERSGKIKPGEKFYCLTSQFLTEMPWLSRTSLWRSLNQLQKRGFISHWTDFSPNGECRVRYIIINREVIEDYTTQAQQKKRKKKRA